MAKILMSFWVEPEIKEWLEKRAEKENRSVGDIVRRLFDKAKGESE